MLIYGLMLGMGIWILEHFSYYYLLTAALGGAMLAWSWPRALSPVKEVEVAEG